LPVETIAEAVQLGAVGVLERPSKPEALLGAVSNALERQAPGAVRGNLRDLGLPSLVSIICNEGRRAALRVQHAGNQATIFFDKGDVVHAVLNDEVGADVVYEVLSWSEGQFVLDTGQAPPERTIHTNWAGLVLEGLRRVDEEAFDQEQLEPVAAEATTPTPAPEAEPIDWSPEAETSHPAAAPRSPTFELDEDTQSRVDERLNRLYQSVELRCVLLTDRSGRLLYLQGDIERSRALSLAALIAGSFSATRETAEIIGHEEETRQFRQSLQEGVDFNLYSAQAGENWILAVAFEPEETILGLARQYALQTATDLSKIASEATAPAEHQEEMMGEMDDLFRQEVGDALEDLFD
jgi:predicted regulator of Ras-like GTPase activity (Roadblock/LC7/MglB family)